MFDINIDKIDKIEEWWQDSFLRIIFWVSIQCIVVYLIVPKYWWFPIASIIVILTLEDLKYE